MIERTEMIFYKLRFLVAGIFVVGCLLLMSLLVSAIWTNDTAQAAGTGTSSNTAFTGASDNPNVVASGLGTAANAFVSSMDSTGSAINHGFRSTGRTIGTAAAQSGKFAARGGILVARASYTGMAFMTRSLASGVVFIVHTPIKIMGLVTNTAPVSAVIKPADHTPVPVIDPNSPELYAALAKMAAKDPANPVAPGAPAVLAAPAIDTASAWPFHGAITTEFGVPEWPYQPIHTGIDISDGNRSGVTPIKPFKPGRVIQTIGSNLGLGNHVVVDHGDGVTSVYGHLYSIAVQVGQEVNKETVLGYEGSTGVSTGTHLHFEIRVNGQAANPHQFIAGQP